MKFELENPKLQSFVADDLITAKAGPSDMAAKASLSSATDSFSGTG